MSTLRFGLIGVDSPHSVQFTQLLGDGSAFGATITHAWQAPTSADFPPSRDRNDDLAAQVSSLGVALCDSPAAVARHCDALLLVASDARTHPELFARVAPLGRPVYVDTRFALTVAQARLMLDQAREAGVLALAGSPKRFTPEFLAARGDGRVERADLVAPLPTQPGHPDFGWYGFHAADLLVSALGPDIERVDASGAGPVVLTWADGRVATVRGEAVWSPHTTGTLAGDGGAAREFDIESGLPMLHGLLKALVVACRSGEPTVPPAEILAGVAIVEAVHESRQLGAPVAIDRGAVRAAPCAPDNQPARASS
ncbi:hypothetical protein BJY21_001942 [Kineosphaera limosa]|uniref:Gfo/Idh/MocA-like oxidoreductase N-terminal domain-containing protein n=1 Tax=Kineosphaera limosa NBRC 100340 TaxID=1184609 RepID=K6X0H0_9MICO|nr:hypothetical protein [Kineosphaera limosa]NYE00758.1 hypothetical protein [Kineosphaera limosa]GAB97832.1 hypothetical protein KILIM_084_00040 [Kineosphaera limosa NBRC 100340]